MVMRHLPASTGNSSARRYPERVKKLLPVSLLLGAIGLSMCELNAAFSTEASAAGQSASTSAADRDTRMAWWRQARFGMFIHWGLYAVPAGEYNGQRSKEIGEWIMSWANIPRAQYEQFATRFNPVKFDAARIVGIA